MRELLLHSGNAAVADRAEAFFAKATKDAGERAGKAATRELARHWRELAGTYRLIAVTLRCIDKRPRPTDRDMQQGIVQRKDMDQGAYMGKWGKGIRLASDVLVISGLAIIAIWLIRDL
jgi:hypothetical protein